MKEEILLQKCKSCGRVRGYFIDINDDVVRFVCYLCGKDFKEPKNKSDIK